MSYDWLDAEFNPYSTAAVVCLVTYLLLVPSTFARRRIGRLRWTRGQDIAALSKFYLRITIFWSVLAAGVVLLLFTPGLQLSNLGIALPSGPHAGAAIGLTGWMMASLGLSVMWARWRVASGRPLPRRQAIASILPHTRRERRLAAAAAIAVGVGEELVFRGLLITFGVSIGLSPYASAALALMIFVVGHAYQGWRGAALTVLPGAALTGLYLASMSVLLPIVVHISFDVASLVLIPHERESAPAGVQSQQDSRPSLSPRD